MIIRIALLLLVGAVTLLVVADVLSPFLPELITQLGLGLLFCAFALLLITGLAVISQQIFQAVIFYCSATQRGQRRVLFSQAQKARLTRTFYCRALRINYDHEQHRQQLLQHNNRKHLAALSKAIDHELHTVKTMLPKTTFKQLQQENRRYCQQQDSAALLQLQQKITSLANDC